MFARISGANPSAGLRSMQNYVQFDRRYKTKLTEVFNTIYSRYIYIYIYITLIFIDIYNESQITLFYDIFHWFQRKGYVRQMVDNVHTYSNTMTIEFRFLDLIRKYSPWQFNMHIWVSILCCSYPDSKVPRCDIHCCLPSMCNIDDPWVFPISLVWKAMV